MKCHDRTHAPSVKYHLLRFKLLQYPRMSKFSSCPEWFAIQSFVKQMFISFTDILLVDKILYHLRWLKPSKSWDVLHINWCRILSVNGMFACFAKKQTTSLWLFHFNKPDHINLHSERNRHWSRWSPVPICVITEAYVLSSMYQQGQGLPVAFLWKGLNMLLSWRSADKGPAVNKRRWGSSDAKI